MCQDVSERVRTCQELSGCVRNCQEVSRRPRNSWRSHSIPIGKCFANQEDLNQQGLNQEGTNQEGLNQCVKMCVRMCQDVLGCVMMCQDVSGCVRKCQDVSGSVRMCREGQGSHEGLILYLKENVLPTKPSKAREGRQQRARKSWRRSYSAPKGKRFGKKQGKGRKAKGSESHKGLFLYLLARRSRQGKDGQESHEGLILYLKENVWEERGIKPSFINHGVFDLMIERI